MRLAERAVSKTTKTVFRAALAALLTALPVGVAQSDDSSAEIERVLGKNANIPDKLDPWTLSTVAVRNHPAVVRIGALLCADVALKLPNGATGLRIENACRRSGGSGTITSSDGYVATNGHIVRFEAREVITGYITIASSREEYISRAQALMDYFVSAKLASRTVTDKFINDLRNDDPDASGYLRRVHQIIPARYVEFRNASYRYALQLSDEPIRLRNRDSKPTFNYSDNIILAKFVDANSDTSIAGLRNNSSYSDVAILKAEGNFPHVRLGDIDELKVGDQLTTIGFPSFMNESGINTEKRNVPAITQGEVKSIFEQSSAHPYQLIETNLPTADGNSGGPAFDDQGRQIGLTTYGGSRDCPKKECFSFDDNIVRDIADYKALLAKNGITLKTDGTIMINWQKGIAAYEHGDYRESAEYFDKVVEAYPASYLAKAFSDEARTKFRDDNKILGVFVAVVLFIVMVLILALIIVFLIVVLRRRPRRSG